MSRTLGPVVPSLTASSICLLLTVNVLEPALIDTSQGCRRARHEMIDRNESPDQMTRTFEERSRAKPRLVPWRRDYAGLGWAEAGQALGVDQHRDAARHPRLAPDQAGPLQREHHLVHAGRRHPEMALQVGFGRGAAMHARVGVDEG